MVPEVDKNVVNLVGVTGMGQEGTRNLGGPRAHTLEAGAIARGLTSERLKPGGLGSNPRSSAEQLGNLGKVIYLSSCCVGWI